MAQLDSKTLILAVVIIVIVVIAIVVFRNQFPDDEDRERHRKKFWIGLAVLVVLIIVVYWLLMKYPSKKEGSESNGGEVGEGGEYGYIDTFRKNRETAAAIRAAGKEAETLAKAQGLSKAQAAEARKLAMQATKQHEREIKIAGQKAAQAAEAKVSGDSAVGDIAKQAQEKARLARRAVPKSKP